MGEDQQRIEQSVPQIEEQNSSRPLESHTKTEPSRISEKVFKAVSALRFWKKDPDKALVTLATMKEEDDTSATKVTITRDNEVITLLEHPTNPQEIAPLYRLAVMGTYLLEHLKDHPDVVLSITAGIFGVLSMINGINIDPYVMSVAAATTGGAALGMSKGRTVPEKVVLSTASGIGFMLGAEHTAPIMHGLQHVVHVPVNERDINSAIGVLDDTPALLASAPRVAKTGLGMIKKTRKK